ncbi:protein kinase domain-containing protein [Pendulispora albinea]|uniref:Serine/threonine protein kinase n=1 Tax=Pendulispora albinea TaxID=2741071 RepID=A0ABZ2M0S4_9BACT
MTIPKVEDAAPSGSRKARARWRWDELGALPTAAERELFADRFRIEREAGIGATGVVYRALDERTGAAVALKILRGADEERFRVEARALEELSHPAIVGYVAHGISRDGEPYLAMHWVEGESLRDRLERGPLDVAETIALGRRLAQALGAAHAMGLVHRDVQPRNVLLPDKRAAKALLVDFGIARFLSATRLAGRERALGTPGYMAPEQARAREDIDGRADLFALGCVLFRCLTNREAFEGPDAFTVIAKLVLHDPPRVSELGVDVPPALDALVARLLNKDRDGRPESATVVEAELALAARDFEWRPGGVRGRARHGSIRWPRLALAGAALSFAALVSGTEAPRAAGEAARTDASNATAAKVGPSAPPVVVTDVPLSPACRADAAASYREGLQAMREATWERAHRAFERAVERDPGCPEVAVRLTMTAEWYWPIIRQREHLRRALGLRGAMRERERILLDMMTALVASDVPDRAAAARVVNEGLPRFPNDAEMNYVAAAANLANASDSAEAVRSLTLAQRATELDPLYADAWQMQGRILALLGRTGDLLSALDRCIQVAPGAGDCLRDRIVVLRQRGQCREAVAEARRWIARDPTTALAYRHLAASLAAEGAPRDTILEALSLRWNQHAPEERAVASLHDRVKLAVWTGDFAEALRLIDQLEQSVAGATNSEPHVRAALMRVETLTELGRGAEAARIAERVLQQRDVWTNSHVSFDRHESGADYYEPVMLASALGRGRITTATWNEASDTWERAAQMTPFERWALRWGSAAGGGIDVHHAVRLAPAADSAKMEPFGYAAAHIGLIEAYEGRLYLEARDPARALAPLQSAAQSCQGLEQPFLHARTHLWLGLAKERTGNPRGACDAYRVVLERWGTPRGSAPDATSVTWREAAARSRALGCPSEGRPAE